MDKTVVNLSEPKQTTLHIPVPRSLADAIQAIGRADHDRPATAMARVLILEALAARGVTIEQREPAPA